MEMAIWYDGERASAASRSDAVTTLTIVVANKSTTCIARSLRSQVRSKARSKVRREIRSDCRYGTTHRSMIKGLY